MQTASAIIWVQDTDTYIHVLHVPTSGLCTVAKENANDLTLFT